MITFNNTIENFNGTVIRTDKFETRQEAKKGARKAIKEFKLYKHAGHIVSYEDKIEMFFSY